MLVVAPDPPLPSPPAPSSGGGGCCVVATAMTQDGDMSINAYKFLNAWAIKKLDKNWLGERLHRGYHIIGPNVAIPLMKSKSGLAKYVKWSFKNATNMLMGKKFDKLSLPNSVFWISAMTVLGLFVSKETAEKSWKKLYK